MTDLTTEKISKLNNAMDHQYSKKVVKNFFQDYKETYNTIRKPTSEEEKEHLKTYIRYLDFMTGGLEDKF
jgi:hypothetical protein